MMETIVLGLSHKSAPIEIREKLSFSAKTLTPALLSLNEYPSIEESIILSTCNRVEIYASTRDTEKAIDNIEDFLSRFHKIEAGLFRECLYSFSGRKPKTPFSGGLVTGFNDGGRNPNLWTAQDAFFLRQRFVLL